MEEIALLDLLVYLFGASFSYILYRLTKRIDSMEGEQKTMNKDINEVKVDIPTNYITKTEHARSMDTIFAKMDAIDAKIETRFETLFDRLDKKVDQ